jgi:hypothetical protein
MPAPRKVWYCSNNWKISLVKSNQPMVIDFFCACGVVFVLVTQGYFDTF